MAGATYEKPCSECGTKHAVNRGNCDPLEKRRGSAVTDPNHPSNNGSWARTLEAMRTY